MPTTCSEIRRTRLKVFVAAMLAGSFGCSSDVPYNPAVELYNNPPAEVSHDHLQTFRVEVDGQDLAANAVEVTHGETVTITGDIVLDTSDFPTPVVFGNVMIRVLPEGASEQRWRENSYAMEWIGPARENTRFPAEVQAPPGVYDYRAYLFLTAQFEDLPTFDYIASGKLRVLPEDIGKTPRPDAG